MSTQTDAFRTVLSVLNEAGIDYMIVGSLAASAHGFVRDTHDLDLVVALDRKSVQMLADKLGEDFYFDLAGAEEALDDESIGMFNIIDYETTVKVDFWIAKKDKFAQLQFSRRLTDKVWGISVQLETPEDTILSKLLWNRITPSERQISDIRGILEVKKSSLDYDYIRKWAVDQGVGDDLKRLLEEQSCQENHS